MTRCIANFGRHPAAFLLLGALAVLGSLLLSIPEEAIPPVVEAQSQPDREVPPPTAPPPTIYRTGSGIV